MYYIVHSLCYSDVSLQFTEIEYSNRELRRFIQPQLQLSTTIATDLIIQVIPLNLTYARNLMLLPESLDPNRTDPDFDSNTQTATSKLRRSLLYQLQNHDCVLPYFHRW